MIRSTRPLWVVALSAASFLAAGLPVQAAEPGPAVGTKAPDFRLTDQSGTERELGDLLGRGKLAIVFYRSADW